MNTLDMFERYIREREQKMLLRTEYGFVIYERIDNDTFYLSDIYVLPESRREHAAIELYELVLAEALKAGATTMLGSVDLALDSAPLSIRMILAQGFDYTYLQGGTMFFSKAIGNKT